eukprot:Skav225935  [mRNA]  locus=scaffold1500:401178:401789:- [translate_table: standard]
MGHAEAVRCLLAAKAKLNMQSEKGITPLHKAAQWSLMRRSQEVIQLLLAAEAAVDMKDAAGSGCQGNGKPIQHSLPEGASHFSTICPGHTPLHLAVHMRCEDAVRLLLAAKAAVDIKNNWRLGPREIGLRTLFSDFVMQVLQQHWPIMIISYLCAVLAHELPTCAGHDSQERLPWT